jgi:hypothetical protein
MQLCTTFVSFYRRVCFALERFPRMPSKYLRYHFQTRVWLLVSRPLEILRLSSVHFYRCHSNVFHYHAPLPFRSMWGYCCYFVAIFRVTGMTVASDSWSFSDMLSGFCCPKQIWRTERHNKAYVCRVSNPGHLTISEHAVGVGSPRGQCALPVQ